MARADLHDDPCDTVIFEWLSSLHKTLTFAIMYGSLEAKFIGDPCDDWSEHVHHT